MTAPATTQEARMTADDEDPVSRASKARIQPLILDSLGIAELQDYVRELRDEISRAEAEIQRKQGHRSNADALFKRS
jgi:uncharacterized small protein (DUF1192 family)